MLQFQVALSQALRTPKLLQRLRSRTLGCISRESIRLRLSARIPISHIPTEEVLYTPHEVAPTFPDTSPFLSVILVFDYFGGQGDGGEWVRFGGDVGGALEAGVGANANATPTSLTHVVSSGFVKLDHHGKSHLVYIYHFVHPFISYPTPLDIFHSRSSLPYHPLILVILFQGRALIQMFTAS
jgi:hypothetical protein